jgi:HD-like signal output (HDOD) protein
MAETKGKILFFALNDDTSASLEERFSRAELTVFKPDNKDSAFDMLRKEKPDIVLTEYNPRSSESIEFLKDVREEYPVVSRAILCEEDDQLKVINLLIKGIITCYFEKSDGMIELIKNILHILEVREILKNKKLLKQMSSIERLPTFPTIYQEFMDAIENDDSLKHIASIVEKDISLATKVLQIVNSAFYGTGKMGSVERACIYLGMETIKNVVFIASLSNMKKLTGMQFNYLERIVHHSLKVNQNFQRFYKSETGKKAPTEYSSIGLTHDVGKIIMLQHLPDRFKKIMKYQRKNPDISFYRSEIELGFEACTHSEIGAYFLDLWNFPETNIYTALYHHAPETAPGDYKNLLEILEMADKFAREV